MLGAASAVLAEVICNPTPRIRHLWVSGMDASKRQDERSTAPAPTTALPGTLSISLLSFDMSSQIAVVEI